MPSLSLRHPLRLAHRWLALLLSPLLALMLGTGLILALEPAVEARSSGAPAAEPVAVAEAIHLLERADPRQRARELALEEGGVAVLTFSRAGERHVEAYDLATAERIEERATASELFRTVRHLHKDLGLGLEVVVEVATYVLLAVLVLGPLLAWPRLHRSLAGWHNLLGWASLPLALLVTATAAMMALELGTPRLPPIDRDAARPALAEALARASAEGGITHIHRAERFEQVAYAVAGRDGEGARTVIVTPDAVAPVAAYPGWVAELHEGTWAGGWSGALNAVAALALLGVMVTGLLSWGGRLRARRAGAVDPGAEVLVAHASQTGTAARLARSSAGALRSAGLRVAERSLAGLTPGELRGYRQVLLIAATTGDGDVPEAGRGFLAALPGTDLQGCRFHLLALGDRRYRRFCAAGDTLHEALVAAGAEPLTAMVRIDGVPGEAWQAWLDRAGEALGVVPGEAPAIEGDRRVRLTLRHREQLNDPADPDTSEVWRLELEAAAPLDYRPGDLLLVEPEPGEPGRPYSIGSSPLEDPRRIRLTVAVTHRVDDAGEARLGKASGLLGRRLAVGDTLDAALRRHDAFRPPEDPQRPMVLVAAGCGIAPFVGFLAERARQSAPGPVWLIFGNRRRRADAFYGAWLEAWRREGVLTRLDTAFSRDPEDGGYAPDRIREQGEELLDWMREADAVLYVCGRRATLGAGIEDALVAILAGADGVPPSEAAAELGRWRAAGRLREDLID